MLKIQAGLKTKWEHRGLTVEGEVLAVTPSGDNLIVNIQDAKGLPWTAIVEKEIDDHYCDRARA